MSQTTIHRFLNTKNELRRILLALIIFASFTSFAEETPNPQKALALTRTVANEMMAALNHTDIRSDIVQLRRIVDQNLVPHIDFRASSSLVLGEHWQQASETQRVEFINEFRSFLVRFYTEALAGYVRTREVPEDLMQFEDQVTTKGARQAFVTSQVKQPNGGTVPVIYRLLWTNDSWQVIDVSVKGISMVKNYRSNFMSTVQQQGLDALIAQLKERNATFSNH